MLTSASCGPSAGPSSAVGRCVAATATCVISSSLAPTGLGVRVRDCWPAWSAPTIGSRWGLPPKGLGVFAFKGEEALGRCRCLYDFLLEGFPKEFPSSVEQSLILLELLGRLLVVFAERMLARRANKVAMFDCPTRVRDCSTSFRSGLMLIVASFSFRSASSSAQSWVRGPVVFSTLACIILSSLSWALVSLPRRSSSPSSRSESRSGVWRKSWDGLGHSSIILFTLLDGRYLLNLFLR